MLAKGSRKNQKDTPRKGGEGGYMDGKDLLGGNAMSVEIKSQHKYKDGLFCKVFGMIEGFFNLKYKNLFCLINVNTVF